MTNSLFLCKNQYISHTLNVSIDHIKTAISNGDHVFEIFVDLSTNAFDTIDHNILLSRKTQKFINILIS